MQGHPGDNPSGLPGIPDTLTSRVGVGAGVMAFWALHLIMGGLRWDHIAGGTIFLLLFLGGKRVRPVFEFILPLILMLAVYDLQAYFASTLRTSEIHLAGPYEFDLAWFGVATPQGQEIPSQWLQGRTHPALDLITGLAYINFVPVFVLTAAWFRFGLHPTGDSPDAEFLGRKVQALMWGMLALNIACCSIYYLYPAAPPWYIERYGFEIFPDVLPDPAGGARFDAITGTTIYADYYSRTPNVFGAVPSLHAAFPLLTLYFSFRLKSLRMFSIFYFFLINFSALYLNHHFVFDLLVGWVMALGVALIADLASGSLIFKESDRIPAFERGT